MISDTHGMVRPEVKGVLQGVEHILHAGDVGSAQVLAELSKIAPMTAVRGNADRTSPTGDLPDTQIIDIGGISIYIIHNIDDLEINPVAAGIKVVLYGHSHAASIREKDGVLYVNPGSVGPSRFQLPATLGILDIDGTSVQVEIIRI